MAIKIIEGYNDPSFDSVEDMFYSNFTPDDWDFIIIGKTKTAVRKHAEKRFVCDYSMKKIEDNWVAVTYHS